MKTGFNSAEIFRKYLWYLLRERKFDTEAVNDVVQLKGSLQLSDEEVGHLCFARCISNSHSLAVRIHLSIYCPQQKQRLVLFGFLSLNMNLLLAVLR